MKNSRASYMRDVMAHLAYLESEDDTLLRDLQGTGVEVDIRRAMIDGVIAELWDQNMQDFCAAMRMADITALQAARSIKAFTALQERRKPL